MCQLRHSSIWIRLPWSYQWNYSFWQEAGDRANKMLSWDVNNGVWRVLKWALVALQIYYWNHWLITKNDISFSNTFSHFGDWAPQSCPLLGLMTSDCVMCAGHVTGKTTTMQHQSKMADLRTKPTRNGQLPSAHWCTSCKNYIDVHSRLS